MTKIRSLILSGSLILALVLAQAFVIAQEETHPGLAESALSDLGRFNDANIPPILLDAAD